MTSCNNTSWKEIDSVQITHSIVHYLYAIDYLHKTNGYARAVDIAKNLSITAGSCSISIKNLLKKGFIIEDENKFIFLSDGGKEIVSKSNYKREVLLDFFYHKLGIDLPLATVQSCKLEHLIDMKIIEKIKNIDIK